METIYILTNESMQDLIKIGFTNGSLEERLQQLDRTSIPLPFNIHYACEVENAREDEAWLHKIFSDKRVRPNREFFKMDPETAVIALKRIKIRDVNYEFSVATEEEQKEIEEYRERRSRFDFETYKIPVGTEIYFSRDESKTAKVLPDNKIEFNGEGTSLGRSAQELLGYTHPPAGTLYWMYEGETLDQRRRRMDGE